MSDAMRLSVSGKKRGPDDEKQHYGERPQGGEDVTIGTIGRHGVRGHGTSHPTPRVPMLSGITEQ